MPEQFGEKTHEATPHRRQQAREKGQVAFSQDLGAAALLIVGGLLLLAFGSRIILVVAELVQRNLSEVPDLVAHRSAMLAQWHGILTGLSRATLPIFGLLLLAGVLSNLFQIGPLWVPERLAPDLSRLNPLQGVKRILSLSGTMRLGFGLFKVLVIGIVAASVLWVRRDEILLSSGFDVSKLGEFLADIALGTFLWVALALFLLALFDYLFQRWKHEQDLRMTHQEIREEMKNLQGDPQVVARRRMIQRQLALNRIGSAVPQADVVVTNPTELAVAIQYAPQEMLAPIVVGKGAGVVAQRIRRLALENNVSIVERKPLAQLLYREVEIGAPVPDDSYAAVAEVLAYVYKLKGKTLPATAT